MQKRPCLWAAREPSVGCTETGHRLAWPAVCSFSTQETILIYHHNPTFRTIATSWLLSVIFPTVPERYWKDESKHHKIKSSNEGATAANIPLWTMFSSITAHSPCAWAPDISVGLANTVTHPTDPSHPKQRPHSRAVALHLCAQHSGPVWWTGFHQVAKIIWLHAVFGGPHAPPAELSSSNKDHSAHKTWNVYCWPFTRGVSWHWPRQLKQGHSFMHFLPCTLHFITHLHSFLLPKIVIDNLFMCMALC